MKSKTKPKINQVRRVKAIAKCAAFEIEVVAVFSSETLVADEMDDVKRKLKNNLANSISKLPFAHTYPYEVRFK